MVLLHISLSLLTIIVPVFLIAVATAYSLHVMSEYISGSQHSNSPTDTVLSTFSSAALPCALAVLTTLFGWSSLFVNRIKAIHEFALSSCFGMLSLLVVILTLLPAVLTRIPLSSKKKVEISSVDRFFDRILDGIVRLNLNHQKISLKVIYGIVHQQLSLQNIEVYVDLEENLPPILAHNTRIEQVIFNLITHAQDAINQKKETGFKSEDHAITIRSFTENDRITVTVSDTGTGIPVNIRNKVFEPFFTTKEVGRGMGLGLSITYGIVRDYDGEIEIQSKEGIGATIWMSFLGIPT